MNITKVSLTPPSEKKPWAVRIEWVVSRVGDDGEPVTDERTLRSTDAPRPSFWATLQALKRAVADACMLAPPDPDGAVAVDLDLLLDAIAVRGVTFRELEEGEGVTVTALRTLDWAPAPLVLNTPFAPAAAVPTEDFEGLLDELKGEAAEYVRGARLQPSLFGGDGAGRGVAREVARAARDLAPDGTGGIESVTISSGDRSVTLTKEDRARFDAMLDDENA